MERQMDIWKKKKKEKKKKSTAFLSDLQVS